MTNGWNTKRNFTKDWIMILSGAIGGGIIGFFLARHLALFQTDHDILERATIHDIGSCIKAKYQRFKRGEKLIQRW